MKIEISTLKSRIITDNPELLKTLIELYSFEVPGHEFSTSYNRQRGWDGKTKYISRAGIFRTGLLSKILNHLKKIDCIPELNYRDNPEKIVHKDYKIENFEYYDYQNFLIEKALEEQRGIVKAPTGSGKTLIMAGIIKALENKKIVILFNAKQLLKQTYDFLTKNCNIKNVGLCFGEGFLDGDIMLCTVQSIDKIIDTHIEDADALLVDEVHEFSKGKLTLAAVRSFPNAQYRVGFTATPPSEDIPKYNLEGAFGPVWDVVSTSALIEEGKLTKPIIQLLEVPCTKEELDLSKTLDYQSVYDLFIVNNDVRNNIIKDIVNEIKTKNGKARILILTRSLDHGRTLENLLGESCQFLEGANSIGERYKAISRFRGCRNSSILIGTKILQTGINIEEITHFINARGMKSEIATLQALGRALRRHESKDNVYIYDFLDEPKYLKKHAKDRKKHYNSEGHEINIL